MSLHPQTELRPAPPEFFAPTTRFPSVTRGTSQPSRRNSLLSTFSTTLVDIVSIAALATPGDMSASTVDSQPITTKAFDSTTKPLLLPAISSRGTGESFRSPVRLRTSHRHMRNRSEISVPSRLELPVQAQIIRDSFHQLVDARDLEELKHVDMVYYLPDKQIRKAAAHPTPKSPADSTDWYPIIPEDHFAFRYEILEFLGLGAFGKVSRCVDHKTGETVAVKVFKKTKAFERQANVEMQLFGVIQMRVSTWSKIVELKEHFKFRGHVCLVYELLSLSLHSCLEENKFNGFSPGWIRRITYQLLEALVELKTCRILHCDIKPENIVFTQDNRTSIKVIDLGSGSFEDQTVYTYIQSRFYRSPEVILGSPYSYPIDMWSLGCVIAELFLGYPLFIGEDEHDQLLAIMEVLGPPPEDMLASASQKRAHFYDDGRPKIVPSTRSRRIPSSLPLAKVLRTNDKDFLDFIERKNVSRVLDLAARTTTDSNGRSTAPIRAEWTASRQDKEEECETTFSHISRPQKRKTTRAVFGNGNWCQIDLFQCRFSDLCTGFTYPPSCSFFFRSDAHLSESRTNKFKT